MNCIYTDTNSCLFTEPYDHESIVFTSFVTIVHFISILEGSGAQKKKTALTNPFSFEFYVLGNRSFKLH